MEYPVVLFDGVCNLCTASVQFVIRHDKKKLFRFAALQSTTGQALLEQNNLPGTTFNSFVLIENNKVYTRSSAALRLSRRLNGILPLLYGFMIVPKFIRDGVYNLIARNRYKWFGKTETCLIPSPDLQARFLN